MEKVFDKSATFHLSPQAEALKSESANRISSWRAICSCLIANQSSAVCLMIDICVFGSSEAHAQRQSFSHFLYFQIWFKFNKFRAYWMHWLVGRKGVGANELHSIMDLLLKRGGAYYWHLHFYLFACIWNNDLKLRIDKKMERLFFMCSLCRYCCRLNFYRCWVPSIQHNITHFQPIKWNVIYLCNTHRMFPNRSWFWPIKSLLME